MKVSTKLYSIFCTMIGLMMVTVLIVFWNLNIIKEKETEALDNRVEQIRLVDEIRVDLGMQGLYARALLIENSDYNEEQMLNYAKELD